MIVTDSISFFFFLPFSSALHQERRNHINRYVTYYATTKQTDNPIYIYRCVHYHHHQLLVYVLYMWERVLLRRWHSSKTNQERIVIIDRDRIYTSLIDQLKENVDADNDHELHRLSFKRCFMHFSWTSSKWLTRGDCHSLTKKITIDIILHFVW